MPLFSRTKSQVRPAPASVAVPFATSARRPRMSCPLIAQASEQRTEVAMPPRRSLSRCTRASRTRTPGLRMVVPGSARTGGPGHDARGGIAGVAERRRCPCSPGPGSRRAGSCPSVRDCSRRRRRSRRHRPACRNRSWPGPGSRSSGSCRAGRSGRRRRCPPGSRRRCRCGPSSSWCRVRLRAAVVARVGHAVGVVVRVAGVALAIAVRIGLVAVSHRRAVVRSGPHRSRPMRVIRPVRDQVAVRVVRRRWDPTRLCARNSLAATAGAAAAAAHVRHVPRCIRPRAPPQARPARSARAQGRSRGLSPSA